MKRVLVVFLLSAVAMASSYRTGKLLAITDSDSQRIVGNTQTGAVQSVTDTEYRLSVELDGMVYVGSYSPRWNWSYQPTDFIVNDPVQVRITGKHMYIKRSGGKELKTSIVRRIRLADYSSAQKPSAQ